MLETPALSNIRTTGYDHGSVLEANVTVGSIVIHRVRLIVPSDGRLPFIGWPSRKTIVDNLPHYDRQVEATEPLLGRILAELEAAYAEAAAEAAYLADQAEGGAK